MKEAVMKENLLCNVCGAAEKRVIAEVYISPYALKSPLVECEKCGLIFFKFFPTRQEEAEYYSKIYTELYGEDFWYESRKEFFRFILKKIPRPAAGRDRLLDVGCSMGFFLKEAREFGWREVVGEEVSKSAVKYANEKLGLRVLEGEIEKVELPLGYFDAVTCWNVIDQLQDPTGSLKRINSLLKPDGFIGIRVTNYSFHILIYYLQRLINLLGIKNELLKSACFHLYPFSKSTITTMLAAAGFKNIKVIPSPIEGGMPSRSALTKLIRRLAYAGSCIIYFCSLGRIVISPSIIAMAEK